MVHAIHGLNKWDINIDLPEKTTCTFLSQYPILLANIVQMPIKDVVRVQTVHTY